MDSQRDLNRTSSTAYSVLLNEAVSERYDYCQSCYDLFDEVRENGVVARSRHGNREFHKFPYEAPSPSWKDGPPENQVEALAGALDEMERRGCRGLFVYQKTGSRWLISEYLKAHPGIASDVEKARQR